MISGSDQRLPLALAAGLICGVLTGLMLQNLAFGVPPGILLGALLHRALRPES